MVAVLLSSCTTNTSSTKNPTTSPQHSGPCPETIVIQAQDTPMSEVGFLYQLLSPDYVIDPVTQSVTAEQLATEKFLDASISLR